MFSPRKKYQTITNGDCLIVDGVGEAETVARHTRRYYAEHFVVALHLLAFDLAAILILYAALEWLEKSTPPNKIGAIYCLRDPTFAKLHTDPRWHALLERLGLAPEQLAAIEFKIKLPK